MPPVQIPTLTISQNAPESASVGRLDVQAPDNSRASARVAGAVERLGGTLIDVMEERTKHARDTKSTQEANDFDHFLENELNGPDGARHKLGDPTPVYQQFDQRAKEKYEEILARNADAPAETQALIRAKLDEVNNKFYDRRTSAFGLQNARFEKEVTDDGVGIASTDMVDEGAYVRADDDKSLAGIDNQIAKIKDLRIKSGIKTGTVFQDDQGNYILNPSVKLQIAKDVSDSLYKTIDNLNSAGSPEVARYLTEKYEKYLDPVNREKANEKTLKATKTKQAETAFDEVRNMPFENAVAKLDKITDVGVREDAMKLLDSHIRMIDNGGRRASKENYNQLASYVMERQNSGSPFQDTTQLERDPMFKGMIDKVTDPKQRKALYDLVNQPKESTEDALQGAQQALFNGEFRGMSPEDFNELMTGLSKSDRKRFTNKYEAINSKTEGETNQQVKQMGKDLTRQLLAVGYLKTDRWGRIDSKSKKKEIEANNEMIDAMENFPPGLTYKEQLDWIKKFAGDKAKGQAFVPPEPPERFQGALRKPARPTVQQAPAAATNVPGTPTPSVGGKSYKDWGREFYRQKKRILDLKDPAQKAELERFIKENS